MCCGVRVSCVSWCTCVCRVFRVSLGPTAAAKGAKGKGAKAAKAAKPAKKPKVTKGKAGAKKDDAGQSADGIKKERDEDGERERDEVRHCIFFLPLFCRPFVRTRGAHAAHTPQENGIKDIDEAYLTLWERLRLDMIRSKSEGAAFLPTHWECTPHHTTPHGSVCSSETETLSLTLFSFGRPRVCALRVVSDRPTERRQGLPHGEPLPERVFPGRHHYRRAGAYLHFSFFKPCPPNNNNAGAVRLNQILALLRYYDYSKAFRIRTTARRRTSSRRSTLCVSRRTLSNSWTKCPASTTTVRTVQICQHSSHSGSTHVLIVRLHSP